MRQSIRQIRLLLFFFIALTGIGLLGSSLILWLLDYESFTTSTLQIVHKESWRFYFQQSVFPSTRFVIARYGVLCLLLFWGIFAYWFYHQAERYSQSILTFLKISKCILRHQIHEFQPTEKRLFALLILLFMLRGGIQLSRYALQYDEAWTYNHFISNGFIVSAISPNNNHILYSLLACLFDYFPFETKYCLRLPVYLGGIATCGLFYLFLRNFWKWQWALVGLAWFAFSPGICFYSMYARGYIFQVFFTLLTTWSTLKLLQTTTKKTYFWNLWIMSNILGFYSIPTYVYVWFLLNVMLLSTFIIEKQYLWKQWFFANLFVLTITSLLFLPFMLTNGLNTLLNIATHEASQGENFWNYQDKVTDWLLLGAGRLTPVYWFLLLIILGLIRCLFTKQIPQKTISVTLIFLLFPSLLNLTIGTQPPYRIWCFLSVFIGTAVPCLGACLFRKNNSTILILLALSFISFNIWRTEVHYAIRWSANLDKNVQKIATSMLNNKLSEVYLFSNYDKPLLEYYYLQENQRLKVFMIAPSSKNYAPFVNASLYQSVLWDKEDRIASIEEQQWLEAHYPIVLYEDKRVVLRTRSQ